MEVLITFSQLTINIIKKHTAPVSGCVLYLKFRIYYFYQKSTDSPPMKIRPGWGT